MINSGNRNKKIPIELEVSELIKSRLDINKVPILISVGGPGGTGKSSFSKKLAGCFDNASILRLDDYKIPRWDRSKKRLFGPHPEANEMELLRWQLEDIRGGRPFFKPIYDGALGYAELTEVYFPNNINILDGEISTYPEFRDLVDLSIFIESRLSTQLNTRVTRDINDRGYPLEKALNTFWGSNMIEFGAFGRNGKIWADILLRCNEDYSLSIMPLPIHK
jgi:uridine kinase